MALEEDMKLAQENRFMRHCGIELLQDEDGSYYTRAEVEPLHQNPYGFVHGGMLFTMSDIAAGAAARQCGKPAVTLGSDFHYLTNVSSGVITARTEKVRVGKTIAVFRVKVESDTGLLLCEGTFTYYFLQV